MEFHKLLWRMKEMNASDLYLKSDSSPMYRIEGNVISLDEERLSPEEIERIADSIMTEKERLIFPQIPEINSGYNVGSLGRFRINIYRQRGTIGIVFRRVRSDIPTIDGLNLPPILKDLSLEPRGLILVTGATGMGKSTTLAAMIEYRNSNKNGHIITIEDPIEFVHSDKKSLISQREVGIDTNSFSDALRNALRQAPDVILIGEMRDVESVKAAIFFSETGHLVLSTLHSTNANQTMERIMQFFPSEIHEQIYLELSLNLKAIISQRLVPGIDGKGRIAAFEVMLSTPRIKDLIQKGEIKEIKSAIQIGVQEGMYSFDQSLYELYTNKLISFEDALLAADSPNDLRLRIKGLVSVNY